MKTCFKCGQPKPLTEFYAHPDTKDGYLNKCKECTKRDVKPKTERQRQRRKKYERERFQQPKRRADAAASMKRYRENNPEKVKARRKVAYAVSVGKLKKVPCSCGSVDVQAHHHDYNKPLEVVWMCFECHRVAHGQLVELPS